MPTNFDLLLEAERRGILPPEKKTVLDEARRRGLVPASEDLERQRKEDEEAAQSGLSGLNVLGFLRTALGQGLALGFGDEIEAGVRSAFGPETYDEALAEAREGVETFRRRNPTTALVSEIGGAIAPAFIPGVGLFGAGARGLGLGARTVRSGATGAGFGAASSFGQGEGGFEERVKGVGDAAQMGGAIGAALPVAGRAAGIAASPLVNAAKAIQGRTLGTVAEDAVIDALRRGGKTPRTALEDYEAIQAATRFRGNSQGTAPVTIAELGGMGTQRLGQTVTSFPGRAQEVARKSLEKRADEQFQRINENLERAMHVRSSQFASTLDDIIDEQKKLSSKAYQTAYQNPSRFDVEDILVSNELDNLQYMGTPVGDMLRKARELFRDRTGMVLNPATGQYQRAGAMQMDIRTFDAKKRALDDMIQKTKPGSNERRLLTEFKNNLVAKADSIVPEYRDARNIFSSRADLIDAAKAGRDFMKGDSEMTAKAFNALSDGEKRMFRMGVAREIRKALGRQKLGDDMTQYFRRPNVREVLDVVFPKNTKMFRPKEQFYKLIDAETKFKQTQTKALGGSDTARIQAGQADFSRLSAFGRALRQTGGLMNAVYSTVADEISSLTRMREADALRAARMLFDTDPKRVRAYLKRLEDRYGAQTVRRIVDKATSITLPTQAGVAGFAGREAGNQSRASSQGRPLNLR